MLIIIWNYILWPREVNISWILYAQIVIDLKYLWHINLFYLNNDEPFWCFFIACARTHTHTHTHINTYKVEEYFVCVCSWVGEGMYVFVRPSVCQLFFSPVRLFLLSVWVCLSVCPTNNQKYPSQFLLHKWTSFLFHLDLYRQWALINIQTFSGQTEIHYFRAIQSATETCSKSQSFKRLNTFLPMSYTHILHHFLSIP
jgi:hypothetical protein